MALIFYSDRSGADANAYSEPLAPVDTARNPACNEKRRRVSPDARWRGRAPAKLKGRKR